MGIASAWRILHRFNANHPSSLSVGFRARRFRFFCQVSNLKPGMTVLDVGGTPWSSFFAGRTDLRVTFLNLYPPDSVTEYLEPDHIYLQGDARAIPAEDAEYDISFSNSLLEHLDHDGQVAASEEIRRVAQFHFVEVPFRFFPWEPHYNFPFAQFAPEAVQRFLWYNWPLSYGKLDKSQFENIILPSRGDLRRLFPRSVITSEKAGFLTKALYAWGFWYSTP